MKYERKLWILAKLHNETPEIVSSAMQEVIDEIFENNSFTERIPTPREYIDAMPLTAAEKRGFNTDANLQHVVNDIFKLFNGKTPTPEVYIASVELLLNYHKLNWYFMDIIAK